MSVYRPADCKTWRCNFTHKGRRYALSTGQLSKTDAQHWEQNYQVQLRRRLGGLPIPIEQTPRFQAWAGHYLADARKHVKRPSVIADQVRVVLRFFGARPRAAKDVVAGEPYHHLRLGDVVADPHWLVTFDTWMTGHGWAASTRNHLRTTVSQMFALALRPAWKVRSGISENPMRDVPRERGRRRTVSVTVEQLRAWLSHASYHVRLAMAIAALAPKLRIGNVLALEWKTHVDLEAGWITVHEHKTDATGRPLAIPISSQLRAILDDAKKRNRGRYVVAYRGRPIGHITDGVRGAAERAGLPYGMKTDDGVTTHTIRHAMATLLAEIGTPDATRQAMMGHANQAMTAYYTHIRPIAEVGPHEALGAAVPIADLVMVPRRRAASMPKATAPKATARPVRKSEYHRSATAKKQARNRTESPSVAKTKQTA
jgi:integrase